MSKWPIGQYDPAFIIMIDVLEATVSCNCNLCLRYWRTCPKCGDISVHLFCNADYYDNHQHILLCMKDLCDFQNENHSTWICMFLNSM